jgi:hypothetical protein
VEGVAACALGVAIVGWIRCGVWKYILRRNLESDVVFMLQHRFAGKLPVPSSSAMLGRYQMFRK